jgi:hypothetical protein
MFIRVPLGQEFRPPEVFSSASLSWREYESYVCGTFERLLPGAKVFRNVLVELPLDAQSPSELDLGSRDISPIV